jgi:c-di-GMP-binding flagellar brake protein YcgR
MIDVSGGGIQLKLSQLNDIAIGDELEFKLQLQSLELETARGEIVRICTEEDPEIEEEMYSLGIKFIGLSDQMREEIIEWVFVKQRELRRKGLI